jgi:hypothetical protein
MGYITDALLDLTEMPPGVLRLANVGYPAGYRISREGEQPDVRGDP